MVGVVAYEMARQLAVAGEAVELLALLDTLSPVIWPDLGWGGLAGTLQIYEHPGDHYSILYGLGAAALAAIDQQTNAARTRWS